ncbi:MAG TPA: hypothetical protein VIL26_02835 [Clostridia bacterium]
MSLTLLAAVSPQKLIIVALAVLVQYLLAMFAFIKISKVKISMQKFLFWNLLIVFIFYIGPTIAIIYAIKKVKKDGSAFDEETDSNFEDTQQKDK